MLAGLWHLQLFFSAATMANSACFNDTVESVRDISRYHLRH
jgi:hypothetical protein